MSTLDDEKKDVLFYDILKFLDDHSVSDLLEVLSYIVREKEEYENGNNN